MNSDVIANNRAELAGTIISPFALSHELYGEKFYTTEVRAKRLSDSEDVIPIIVSERVLDVKKDYSGSYVHIEGQFRSYNEKHGAKTKLVLMLMAKKLEPFEDGKLINNIFLDGFVCKKPIYRVTPLGKEIADVLLAVNRTHGKSDYIPCVCWGSNAKAAGEYAVGDRISINGRIQSRNYEKKTEDGSVENHVAYEVSVGKLVKIEQE
ncbi:MAG: single-stranded DNA-binding protein [Lachnospiraceae bacterium]|nr:single-stranded DNA-binding protein [Lachnospiraceae bacterium]